MYSRYLHTHTPTNGGGGLEMKNQHQKHLKRVMLMEAFAIFWCREWRKDLDLCVPKLQRFCW